MGGALIEQNLVFLRQAAELVAGLDEAAYTPPPGGGQSRRSGVGPHLRHCLDFYLCFLRDLDGGRIDYDHRARDRGLETDLEAARSTIEEIFRRLRAIDPERLDDDLEMRSDVAPFEDPNTAWCRSTVARELRFLASHTVHHFALIAPLLRDSGVDPGPEFGVAPSTLTAWGARGAGAR